MNPPNHSTRQGKRWMAALLTWVCPGFTMPEAGSARTALVARCSPTQD